MPRRKLSMELIPNRRVRAATFARRKEGLRKKAGELATLCGVRVALVCADGDGGAAGEVWESEAGVLDAYRRLGAPERAKHTHRAYAERELGKEVAKLARVRQGGPTALAPWDEALDGVSPEEARRLLQSIDAALMAVNERMRALGLPGDDGGGLPEGVAPGAPNAVAVAGLGAPPCTESSFLDVDSYVLPQGNGSEEVTWDNGFQFHPSSASMMHPAYGFQQCASRSSSCVGMDDYWLQMAPDLYGNNNGGGRLALDTFELLNAAAMQRGYGLQCTSSSYGGMDGCQMQQGPGNGGGVQTNLAVCSTDEPRNAATTQRGCGLQCDSSSYAGVDAYRSQQAPGNVGIHPSLAMWRTGEPCNAIFPVEYPSFGIGHSYMDTLVADAVQGTGGRSLAVGGNFINAAQAQSLTVGTGDNFASAPPAHAQPLAMSYCGDLINLGSHATQWPDKQLQSPGSSEQSGLEQLHYLSDLEDMQQQLWGN